MRSKWPAAVLVWSFLGCAGCGRSPSAPPPDEADKLVADRTISDVEAIQRAVDLDPGWFATFGTPPWQRNKHGPDLQHEATRIEVDQAGAPALFIKCAPGIGVGTSSRVSAEPWTIEQERQMDLTTLLLKADAIARVARVGAARRLRFIDLTFIKYVSTADGDKTVPVLHAVAPQERLALLAGPNSNFYLSRKDMERAWNILEDDYDSLRVMNAKSRRRR